MWASAPTQLASQAASRSRSALHERPLRGTDAQCAPLRRKQRDCAKKLPCAKSNPCSEAVRAAFVETPVAVTVNRFYWPARSREGAGSMGRDSPVERNCLRNASPWDARRAAQGSPGAAAPGAFWGLFRGEKSPAGGQGKGCRHASAAPAAETADATLAADSRPYGWRSRPGAHPTQGFRADMAQSYNPSVSLREPALLTQGSLPSQASGPMRSAVVHPTRRVAGRYGHRPLQDGGARVHSIRFRYWPV